MNKKIHEKKLSKYTKEDLIRAILEVSDNAVGGMFWIEQVLYHLTDIRREKLREKASDALDKNIVARKNYQNWLKEMAMKYGDGKSVSRFNIPLEDVNKGAELERKMLSSEKQYESAREAENKSWW